MVKYQVYLLAMAYYVASYTYSLELVSITYQFLYIISQKEVVDVDVVQRIFFLVEYSIYSYFTVEVVVVVAVVVLDKDKLEYEAI